MAKVLEFDDIQRTYPGWDLGDINDVLLTSVSNDQVLYYEAVSGKWKNRTLAGSGDVMGPAGSTADELVSFNSTTGKVVKGSGLVAAAGKITTGEWNGTTMAVAYGGTGVATTQAAKVFAGPLNGADAAPAFRVLATTDIPDLSGTYQPLDAGLTSISGLTTAADTMIYTTAADTYATASLTAAGRAILDDATAGDQRTTLDVAQKVAASTDLAFVRFNGITGQHQNSATKEDASGNVTVTGNLTVQGQSFQADHIIQTASTFLLINSGETGAGVTNLRAGLDIDRGTLNPYRIQSHETTDDVRVGLFYATIVYSAMVGPFQFGEKVTGATSGAIGYIVNDNGSTTMRLRGTATAFQVGETINGATSVAFATVDSYTITDDTQALATREDAPNSAGIAYWNNSAFRLDTMTGITATATSMTVVSSGTLDVSAGTFTTSAAQKSTILTGAVILAPDSSTRNIIQSTGDFVPLTVRAKAGQTTFIFRVEDPTGATGYLSMQASGVITLSQGLRVPEGSTGAPSVRIGGSDTGIYAASNALRLAANSTYAAEFSATNSTLNFPLRIGTTANGTVAKLTVNPAITADNAACVMFTSTADANKALVIQRFSATATANMTEWQSSAGAVLLSVTSAGNIYAGGVVGGEIQYQTTNGGAMFLANQAGLIGGVATNTGGGRGYSVRSTGFYAFSSVSTDAGNGTGCDVYLRRQGANSLSLRNTTNAQCFSAFNTYTDASNYETGLFCWQTTANVLTIGAAALGTGTVRPVSLVGASITLSANVYTDRFTTASATNTIFGVDAAGTGNMAHTTGSTGWYNTFVGNLAGQSVSSGHSNTSIGYSAGRANTAGAACVCIGRLAGDQSADGTGHTLVGYESGFNHRNGQMTAFGYQAGRQSTYGSLVGMTAIGYRVLFQMTAGAANNTALGFEAGLAVSSSSNQTLIGYQAGVSLTTGETNTFIGSTAGQSVTTATASVGVGFAALKGASASASAYNVAVGNSSGFSMSTGANNCLYGHQSGYAVTTGSSNILLGFKAGDNITTGIGNIIIATDTDASAANVSNELNIGGLIKGSMTGTEATASVSVIGALLIGAGAPSKKLGIIDSRGLNDHCVQLTNNGNADFMQSFLALAPNLASGHVSGYTVGTAFNGYNAGYMAFYTNGAGNTNNYLSFGLHSVDDIMVLTGNNRVGIGIAAPLYKVHTYVDTTSAGAQVCYQYSTADTANSSFELLFKNATDLLSGIKASNPSAVSPRLEFLNWTGSAREVIFGLYGANMGIGTTAPTSKLSLAGDFDQAATDAHYFGAPTTDGTWKFVRSGNDFLIQRRESGSYVTKSTITA